MKRYTTLALSMVGLLAFALPAFAGSTTDGGAQVVISDSVTNTDLIYNPSPGVVMGWLVYDSSFALTSTNLSANYVDRNEYGIASDYNGYYQIREEDSTSPEAADQPLAWDESKPEGPSATNFQGWVAMGGAGSGTADSGTADPGL
jgi:hypothetical protein